MTRLEKRLETASDVSHILFIFYRLQPESKPFHVTSVYAKLQLKQFHIHLHIDVQIIMLTYNVQIVCNWGRLDIDTSYIKLHQYI